MVSKNLQTSESNAVNNVANKNEEKKQTTKGQEYTLDEAINKIGFGVFQYILFSFSILASITNAMQLVLQTLLGGFISCEWKLYEWQIALLNSILFVGFLFGGFVFSTISDKFGRKKVFFVAMLLVLVFTVSGAFLPSYYCLLVSRGLVGFAVGGVFQIMPLCLEYSPTTIRGKASFILSYFWSIGEITAILLAWIVMRFTNSWRLFTALTAIFAPIILLGSWWLPESARFLAVNGRTDSAHKIMVRIANTNNKEFLFDKIKPIEDNSKRGRFVDLFVKKFRFPTLLLGLMMFFISYCYYGIKSISPIVVGYGNIYYGSQLITNISNATNEQFVSCTLFTDRDYFNMMWQAAADLPRILFIKIIMNKIDKNKVLSCICSISAAAIFLQLLYKPYTLILVFMFISRALLSTSQQLTYIIISEIFPTTLHSILLGTISGSSAVGGILSVFVTNLMVPMYPVAIFCTFGIFNFLAGAACFLLTKETRDRKLSQHVLADDGLLFMSCYDMICSLLS